MTFEKLNYYVMMGKIADQILDIKERRKLGKTVKVLNVPDSFSPEDLLRFQFERIHILEVATKCSEDDIKKWLMAIDARIPHHIHDEFRNRAEKELLETAFI